MNKQTIENLKPACRPGEYEELAALYNGYISCLNNYNESKAKKDLLALEAAKKALKTRIDDLEQRLAEPVFDGVIAALKFLRGRGYKIAKSKLYNDKNAGLIRTEADGKSFKEGELLAYALRAELKRKPDQHKALDEKAIERDALQVELLQIKKDREMLALQKELGEVIRKSDVIAEFIGRMVALEAGFRNIVQTYAADMIHAVGGDAKKKEVFIAMISAKVDGLVNELATLEEINIEIELKDSAA